MISSGDLAKRLFLLSGYFFAFMVIYGKRISLLYWLLLVWA